MSIALQKQIKDNATDVSSYRQDLVRWTEELERAEVRREKLRRGELGRSPAAPQQPASQGKKAADATPDPKVTTAMAAMDAMAAAAGLRPKKEAEVEQEDAAKPAAEPIRRDGQGMHKYYSSWDQFDVDGELERLDEQSLAAQRAEAEARRAERDKILDEMALTADGDRSRTSKARPRVKISVRTSGRRASPVDLAVPKKEEANRYFSEGRFRDAVAVYTAALDLLEKYEPPSQTHHLALPRAEEDGPERPRGQEGDCAGLETEALSVKTTLLANRAAALLKLEEWREVIADCTEALRFDPQHAKATLRRGFAYARQKRWGLAARDLELSVAWDPGDKKAAAELQMARRMLEEQNREAREHARHTMCDPTRTPALPARRLQVRAQRGLGGTASVEVTPAASSGRSSAAASAGAADASAEAGPSAAPAPTSTSSSSSAPPPAPAERRPYVPRSVRMRGGPAASAAQGGAPPGAAPAAAGAAGGGGPGLNFYAFEAQWNRHRGKPAERMALLRRVGAAALPALCRESLDAELVAATAEVLASELAAAHSPEGSDTAAFAADIMAALARTHRFDASCRCLSAAERAVCAQVLDRVAELGGCGPDRLAELRAAYAEPAPASRPTSPGGAEVGAVATARLDGEAPPAAPAVASVEEEDEDDVEEVLSPEAAARAAAAAKAAASFSLDGCD